MTQQPDEFSNEETAKRRDEVLKRMLNTKPEPRVTHPQSRVRNQKKAGAEQPDRDPGKTDPSS